MKIAIITGASSGMGKDFARQVNKRFSGIEEIWLIARRTEKMEELAEQLDKPCKVISADFGKQKDLFKITGLLVKHSPDVKMLINCSGFGKLGGITDIALEDTKDMIEVNCVALTDMVYKVLPYMKARSVIINMASSAAFVPQPNFAVYAATKSYVLSFTRALRREVKERGIKVTAVCPGPVKTEFFEIAEEGQDIMWYKKFIMVSSERVVKKAINDALDNKELSICGLPMKMFYIVSKVLPHRCILSIVSAMNKVNKQ